MPFEPNLIILSYPTTGVTGAYAPAATYKFVSRDYKAPVLGRSIGFDVVHNQNGVFKYVYDNGPNFGTWDPFQLVMDDNFENLLGVDANAQWDNLIDIWSHIGPLRLSAPDGVHDVHWAQAELQRDWIAKPRSVGDKLEYNVTVQFEEA